MTTTSRVVFAAGMMAAALAVGTARAESAPGAPAGEPPPVVAAAKEAAAETKQAALSFVYDVRNFPLRLWQDVQALPSIENGVILGLGGLAAGVSHDEWDDDVRDWTRSPGRHMGGPNDVLDVVASAYTVYGVSALMYGTSLFTEDPKLHAFSLDMISSLSLELPAVYGLKKAFDTERPNGDDGGFPSGHTAVATSFAALLNSYYGPWAGLAGASFAGLVAFHRIDDRKHDLSDVIFGAALGYVAGQTAADVNEVPVVHAHLLPLAARDGTPGLRLEWRF